MRKTARRPYSRAALLLLALLSTVLLSSVQSLSCEMHGLRAAQGVPTNGLAMADHGVMTAMSHHGSQTGGGDEDGDCCCTCIGDCTMVAPLATPITAVTIRVALAAPEPRRALETESARSPAAEPDRLLPFANGPPASALL